MLLSKEELSGEIWSLNVVRISDSDFTFGSHVDHGKVFKKLTADGSCTDDEKFHIFDFIHILLADNYLNVSECFFFLDW